MIGILPTLADGHLSPSHMSANPRYRLISEQILARAARTSRSTSPARSGW